MQHDPNQISYENHIPELLEQLTRSMEYGDHTMALRNIVMLLSHMLWRIQELEKECKRLEV